MTTLTRMLFSFAYLLATRDPTEQPDVAEVPISVPSLEVGAPIQLPDVSGTIAAVSQGKKGAQVVIHTASGSVTRHLPCAFLRKVGVIHDP